MQEEKMHNIFGIGYDSCGDNGAMARELVFTSGRSLRLKINIHQNISFYSHAKRSKEFAYDFVTYQGLGHHSQMRLHLLLVWGTNCVYREVSL